MDTQRQQTQLVTMVEQAKTLGANIPGLRYPVALWYALRDPATPLLSKIIIGGALAYVAMPFDLVPDFIPVLGYVDDVAVVAFAYKTAKKMVLGKHLAEADSFLGN